MLLEHERKPKKVKMIKKGKTTELMISVDDLHPNYNELITNILEEVGLNEKNTGNGVKHKAYMKAATALQIYPKKVESGEEAKKLDGIGVKIAKKIDEIIQTGRLEKLEKARKDKRLQSINELCKVSGIGYECLFSIKWISVLLWLQNLLMNIK